MIFVSWIIAILLQSSSMSDSICELKKMVFPCFW